MIVWQQYMFQGLGFRTARVCSTGEALKVECSRQGFWSFRVPWMFVVAGRPGEGCSLLVGSFKITLLILLGLD